MLTIKSEQILCEPFMSTPSTHVIVEHGSEYISVGKYRSVKRCAHKAIIRTQRQTTSSSIILNNVLSHNNVRNDYKHIFHCAKRNIELLLQYVLQPAAWGFRHETK